MWYRWALAQSKVNHHIKRKRHHKLLSDDDPGQPLGVDTEMGGPLPSAPLDVPEDILDDPTRSNSEVGGEDLPMPGVAHAPGEPLKPELDRPAAPRFEHMPKEVEPEHILPQPEVVEPGHPEMAEPEPVPSMPEEPEQTETEPEPQSVQPQPSRTWTGPNPPIHEHCHCEIKTLPGGRQVWRTNETACTQCQMLRDQFNQMQDVLHPVDMQTEVQTEPMRRMLTSG
jgi:hypothetical protein